MEDVRYDRQLRLWGEEGQNSIKDTSVCLLGCSALGTEVLKNLVLAGIGSFCILDNSVVEPPDLGQNFFITEDDIGKSRGTIAVNFLKELNPSVKGDFRDVDVYNLSSADIQSLADYNLVVGTNLPNSSAVSVSTFLFDRNIPFITCRVFGLIGYLRISVKEHTIANCHEDNPRADMRIDRPFPALLQLVNEMKPLAEMTMEEFKHTPYILLLFSALHVYRKERGVDNAFPMNYKERKDFSTLLKSLQPEGKRNDMENADEAIAAVNRVMQLTKIPDDVLRVLNDEQCSPSGMSTNPFWTICTAIRRFAEKYEVLPLSGKLPDMTSDSRRYAQIATAFHEKALQDAAEVHELVKVVEKEREIETAITLDVCYRFCKNASGIRLIRGSCISEDDDLTALLSEIQNCDDIETPETKSAIWLLLLKAADKFAFQKGRYPGTNGGPCTIDSDDLTQRLASLIKQDCLMNADVVLHKIGAKPVQEICRYGSGEPHVMASFLGGIVAQEVIKLATNQYIPIDNTFVYDGLTQNCRTFKF